MTINYADEESFYEGVYQLCRKGLTFEADFKKLQIKLLGGY